VGKAASSVVFSDAAHFNQMFIFEFVGTLKPWVFSLGDDQDGGLLGGYLHLWRQTYLHLFPSSPVPWLSASTLDGQRVHLASFSDRKELDRIITSVYYGVTNTAASVTSDTTVHITWTSSIVASCSGQSSNSFYVSFYPSDISIPGGSCQFVNANQGPTNCDVTGLTPGMLYQFAVNPAAHQTHPECPGTPTNVVTTTGITPFSSSAAPFSSSVPFSSSDAAAANSTVQASSSSFQLLSSSAQALSSSAQAASSSSDNGGMNSGNTEEVEWSVLMLMAVGLSLSGVF